MIGLPSLETLVNQCCEDHYYKLPTISSEEIQKHHERLKEVLSVTSDPEKAVVNEKFFNFKQFKQFIISSHCFENLHFLIEIYHYEKIWNRVFKRQSSILKCKDEIISQQRKLSVGTILTNQSPSKLRRSSIMEEPEETEEKLTISGANSPETFGGYSPVSETDLDSPLYKLILPSVVTSENEFDIKSFVKLDAQVPQHKPPGRNTEVWESLFAPSFCKEQEECSCKDDLHHHDLKSIYEEDHDERLRLLELREKSKDELVEKFSYIIEEFVLDNSPYEVNLPGDVYTALISEYENNKVLFHSPLTLLPAKNAVLQLLRENIYYNFVSKQQKLASKIKNINQQVIGNVMTEKKGTNTQLIYPKPTRSPPHLDDSDLDSSTSQESSRRTTPVQSITNFLNKYHLKIPTHDSNSSTSVETNSPTTKRLNSPKPSQGQRDRSSTQPASFQPSLNSSSTSESLTSDPGIKTRMRSENVERSSSMTHKRLGSHYVKGPCGIDPNMAAYNPKPPSFEKRSHWGSKFLRFKKKIKDSNEKES